jgi:hypothetical protein
VSHWIIPAWAASWYDVSGMDANEDGVPVIVAVPCPDERVATMELLDAESVLEGTPTTYWRVRSDQGVYGKTYVLPINN